MARFTNNFATVLQLVLVLAVVWTAYGQEASSPSPSTSASPVASPSASPSFGTSPTPSPTASPSFGSLPTTSPSPSAVATVSRSPQPSQEPSSASGLDSFLVDALAHLF